MGKYRVMMGGFDTKWEKNYDIECTDKEIRKHLVDLKRKYKDKGVSVLIMIGKYEDGKLYTFLRN